MKGATPHSGANVLVDPAERSSASLDADVISGGNFHASAGFRSRFSRHRPERAGGISERRLERLVNPALSEGLPPFLAASAGLNSGF